MIIENVHVPNEIIDAAKEGKLVVFAGAGVSIGEPTKFPSYIDLTKRIASGTSREFDDEKDKCEVFLGELAAAGIDVKSRTAKMLPSEFKHNAMHEAIIDLFHKPEDIRIVTTNFDLMFEQVLQERDVSIDVYSGPALPLGDNFTGLVHLHGDINKPSFMILTDEDFGYSYLTEGYISRFLAKLFSEYVIVFVGYSYSDTMMWYFTRAISRSMKTPRYIFTEDEESDWSVLGLTPILFPSGKYDILQDVIIKLGQRINSSLLDLREYFGVMKETPNRDSTEDSEVDYCLRDISCCRAMLSSIEGEAWLEYLNGKGAFDRLFTPDVELDKIDVLLADFLLDKYFLKPSFDNLMMAKRFSINDDFSKKIIQKIKFNLPKDADESIVSRYIAILIDSITDSQDILILIEILLRNKEYYLCFEVFKKNYDITISSKKGYWSKDSYESVHIFLGQPAYCIRKEWDDIKGELLPEHAKPVLFWGIAKLEELYHKYDVLEGRQSWEVSCTDIEHDYSYSTDNALVILSDIICFSSESVENKEEILFIIKDYLKSNSILARRIGLKMLKECQTIDPDEKLDILLSFFELEAIEEKQQIFLLVGSIAEEISSQKLEALLDAVETISVADDTHSDYAKYNWAVYLEQNGVTNVRIKSLISIGEEKGFRPRKHPEKLFWIESGGGYASENTSFTGSGIKEIPYEKLTNLIIRYQRFDEYSSEKGGFYDALSTALQSDYDWAFAFVDHLLKLNKKLPEEAWRGLLIAIKNSDYSSEQRIRLLDIMCDRIGTVSWKLGFVEIVNELVRAESSEFIDVHLKKILKYLDVSWKYNDEQDFEGAQLIDICFSSITGMTLYSWILIYGRLNRADRNTLLEKFDLLLRTRKRMHKQIAVCLFAGHIYYFLSVEKEWAEKKLIRYLVRDNQYYYRAAWEGIVFFSGNINKTFSDISEKIYHDALKHLSWLGGDVKRGVLERLVILLIYIIREPIEFIPCIYDYASDEDRKTLVNIICFRLGQVPSETRESVWNNWFRQFVINLSNNIPKKPVEGEKQELLDFILKADTFYEDAVDVICDGLIPNKADGLFLYEWNNSGLVEKYPKASKKLLIALLINDVSMNFFEREVRKIARTILGASDSNELREILLAKGITDWE